MVTVVVPAHNEERVIRRLLAALAGTTPAGAGATQGAAGTTPDGAGSGDQPGGLRVVVVCNGCTDDTAGIAAGFPGVTVLQTPVPSKREALRLGDSAAGADYPRVYVDADVEIGRADVLGLAAALEDPAVLAAAPARVIPRAGVSPLVRWYYDVWEQLPGVRRGIFGRGVVAVSAAGHERISALPLLMADDLAMSSAFGDGERRVVESSTVVVHPPRTWSDLMRRRVRAATGTAQAYAGAAELQTDSRTSLSDLRAVVRARPGLALRLPVFVAVALLARRQAARAVRMGDFSTWLRDESSRETA